MLLSPYLRLVMPVPRLNLAMAGTLSRVAPALPLKSEIRVEMLSRDEDWQRETTADRLIGRVATPRWFCTSSAAQEALLRRASEITVPTLILHGREDPIADPNAARELHDRLGSPDKTLRLHDGMRHEMLREFGREEVLGELIAWLDARRPLADTRFALAVQCADGSASISPLLAVQCENHPSAVASRCLAETRTLELLREICAYIGIAPGKVEIRRFSNENLFIQILENVREADVFVVQPFSLAGP